MGNPLKKVSWKALADITLHIIEGIVPQVGQIEAIVKQVPQLKDLTGADKKAAVLSIISGSLQAAEGLADKDLLNDADVLAAAGGVVDAVVALQNIIAAKKAEKAQ